ncbi:MAG: ThiF family adenylyltransferase [Halothiobacillaceae bacterium]|nr:ThiF family adenylyltransferase [Halothiobacillaceae bacterium]
MSETHDDIPEDMSDDMHERTRLLIGEEGLARLARAHVLVAGLGGVGGACAEALCRAGVGRLSLLDHDHFSASNLNRQLLATREVLGRGKAEVAAERLRSVREDVVLEVRAQFLQPDEADGLMAEGRFDAVADCIDSIACKAALIAACQRQGVPVFSSLGAGGRTDVSQVRVGRLDKVEGCGLGRELRKRLRRLEQSLRVPVIHSTEPARGALPHQASGTPDNPGRPRAINGTISYMPNLFGMMLAGELLTRLLSEPA